MPDSFFNFFLSYRTPAGPALLITNGRCYSPAHFCVRPQAEMERALLQGELTAQLEKIQQDERWLDQLTAKDHKLAQELDAYRQEEMGKIAASKGRMEAIEQELNR